jgi:hypothetical protein
MSRIYVSTTSSRLERAAEVMAEARYRGHTITYDWVEGMAGAASMDEAELARRAQEDIDGVGAAHYVVVIMLREMKYGMVGTSIEIGAALACRRPVIVVEEERIFPHFFGAHPLVHPVGDLEDAFELIEQPCHQFHSFGGEDYRCTRPNLHHGACRMIERRDR